MVGTLVDPVGLTVLSNPENAMIDIVFVHGLQGHPRNTWTASSNSPSSSKNTPLAPSADWSPFGFLRRKRKRLRETDEAENSVNIENARKRPRETDQVENSANIEDVHNDTGKHEVFWPKDLLAADLPKARIMTFGYNTNIQQGFHAVNQGNLFSHARNLLFDLEAKRRQTPTRHLIFVAHSLGGILVKEVLRRSETDYNDEIKQIYASTTGIFFFGTPHRGSKDWASFGEGVTAIAGNILGMDVNRQVMHALVAGAELELCRESFTVQWARRGNSLTVRTFQEAKGMTGVKWGGFNQLIVPPDSSILDHPDQRARTIEANHITMVQFSSRSDRGYEMVMDDIKELILKAENMAKISIPEYILSEEECKCLQTLRTSEYEQFKDRNPLRLDGTCRWFLPHENFKSWREGQSSSLLWVSADPGCGKSVLSKSLVDKDLKTTDSTTVCYYFFKDDNDKQKSHTAAFSALLHQLLSRKQYLIKYALPDYVEEGSNLPQVFTKLWKILTKATCDSKVGEVLCILDALDECEESGRYSIIEALSSFYRKAETCNKSRLKFLVTSRPYFDIERRFAQLTNEFPTIRLRGEQESKAISFEINIVIKQRVLELGVELNLQESEKNSLEDELLSMTHRTYLWLKLVFDVIRSEIGVTTKKLKRITGTLPATLDQAYEAILSKSRHRRQAQKALHIIVAAKRPLTLKEMNIALAIEDHHQSYEDLDLENEARFATTLRNLCGLFVNVIDQKIYLIHQTAKEFLIAEDQAALGCWKHSLSPTESELVIARTCITYLMFDIFKDGLINYTKEEQKQNHGYLEYAANFWGTHYGAVQDKTPDLMFYYILSLYDARSPRFKVWLKLCWDQIEQYKPSPGTPPIIAASIFGHEFVVKHQLDTKADVDSKDGYNRTPLLWAARLSHENLVKLLLEAKADVDSKDGYNRTPLLWAANLSHENISNRLLDDGADIESMNIQSQTPLLYAAEKGHGSIFKRLLDAGADIESKNEYGQTPLMRAVKKGHESIFKQLLEAGADIESKDYFGRTPFFYTVNKYSKECHDRIAERLLESGADIESKDEFGRTPLYYAITLWSTRIFEQMLKAGADIESKDSSGLTPISWAARNGKEYIIKQLIEAGADVESKDNDGHTPLWWAAKERYDGVYNLIRSVTTAPSNTWPTLRRYAVPYDGPRFGYGDDDPDY